MKNLIFPAGGSHFTDTLFYLFIYRDSEYNECIFLTVIKVQLHLCSDICPLTLVCEYACKSVIQ